MSDKIVNLKINEQAYREFEVDGHFFEQTIKCEAWTHEYGDGYIVKTICSGLEYSEHGYESTVAGIQAAVRLANCQERKAKKYVERLGKSEAATTLENDGWEITVDV